jgi:hypothetical protein
LIESELIFRLALRVHTATLLSSAMPRRASDGRGSASRAAQQPAAHPSKTKAKRERRLARKKSSEEFAEEFAKILAGSDKEGSDDAEGSSGSGDDSGDDSDAVMAPDGEDNAKQAEVLAANPAEQMQLKNLPDSNLVLTCSACGGLSKDSPPPKALHWNSIALRMIRWGPIGL